MIYLVVALRSVLRACGAHIEAQALDYAILMQGIEFECFDGKVG